MVALTCVARGIGGIDDLRAHLDPSRVLFGVLRFTFGKGTFARDKYVFVHWNGDACSVVKRGRANAQKQAVEVRDALALCMMRRASAARVVLREAWEDELIRSRRVTVDADARVVRIVGGAFAVAREHEFY